MALKPKAKNKYSYTFADESLQEIEVSEEWAKTLAELDREEKNANRRETRRHVSIDKRLDRNVYMRDYTQDIEFAEECREFEESELRLECLQRKAFEKHLTPRQAEAFYQYKVLKYRKTRIGKNMGVTESAVRKLIGKAEEVIYPALFKALKENDFEAERHSDGIDFDNLLYLDLLINS